MRWRLWHRWFLLSAGLVLLALAAMLWVQEQGFRRGLLAHANALEQARLPELAERFADEYRSAGSWWRLQQAPQRWRHLLRPEGAEPPPRPPFARPRPPGPGRLRPAEPGERGVQLDFVQRLALLDAHRQPLIGRAADAQAKLEAIQVGGRVVGWLALQPMPALQNAADLDFARAQRSRAVWIALPVLLAAMLASLALSKTLLRRMDRVAAASRRLAAGDYDTRLQDAGSDELGELARDVDRLADALQAGRHARDRWVADISHELRTPLTILRGELQALQDGIRPLDAAALASLAVEAERLSARVDDLYALALSDSGGLAYRYAECDLASLLKGLAERRRNRFEAAGLSLHIEVPTSLRLQRADAARLEQLFDNLLANSLRYTDGGGQVRIELRLLAAVAEVRIDDSAPAIAAEELPQLLTRHYRGADSERRAAGGAGLGLAISHNIVLAHGGQLRLAHSSLGGLQVLVRLPLAGGVL